MPPQKPDIEHMAKELVNTLAPYLDVLVATTEERMEAVTDAYVTGQIQINNHNHIEKIVQLFYLIQNITAPKELAKSEQVFKQFSATDIASILHLHFEAFKNKKINTIQGNIKVAADNLNFKNPKVQKLNKALEEFFILNTYSHKLYFIVNVLPLVNLTPSKSIFKNPLVIHY